MNREEFGELSDLAEEESDGFYLPMIRTVSKRGGSLTVNIPAKLVKAMELKEGCPVLVRCEDKKIYVEKVEYVTTESGRKVYLGKIVSER